MPGHPEREDRGHEAQPDVEPVRPQRRPARAAAAALVDRDPVVLEDEVGDEVGEHQPGEDEDGVGHVALPTPRCGLIGDVPDDRVGAGDTIAEDGREAGGETLQVADPAAFGDDGDRGAAHPQAFRGLGLPEPVHDEEAPNLALADGELPEEGGQERPELREQVVRGGIAGRGRQPEAMGLRALQQAPSGAERGPVRSVAGPVPGSTSPAAAAQRRPRASGRSAARTMIRNGSAPGTSRSWISSPWVNPAGARRSWAVARIQLLAQGAKERGGAGVAARIHDVAEQHRGREHGRHTLEPTAP